MKTWVADFLERHPESSRFPIEKKEKNSIHFKRNDREMEGHFTGGPIYYSDRNGVMQPLDPTLKLMGSEYGAEGLTPKIKLSREVKAGSYTGQTNRIGSYNPETGKFIEIVSLSKDGKVDDNKIITESGIFRHELILTETGLRDETIISRNPELNNGEWLAIETSIKGRYFADGEVKEFKLAGYSFPEPRVWDANGNIAPCKRFAIKNERGVQVLLTCVPAEWLNNAKYDVVVDPDFAAGASYGYILGQNVTYATARSTSTSSGTNGVVIGQLTGYTVYRSALQFATGTIGAGATVTQANLTGVCTTDGSTTNFIIDIVDADWSASDPITAGNRETVYDLILGTANPIKWKNTADGGFATNTQYTSDNLATAYVKKTASTFYGLISAEDIANSAPTNSEYINMGEPNHATVGYRPFLTVLYSIPVSGGMWFAM